MRLGVAAALVDGVLVPGDVEVDDGSITAVGVGAGVGSARQAMQQRRERGRRL